MKLTIPGEPAAKGRPKFTRAGIAYTPKKTVNYETLVKQIYAVEHPGERFTGKLKAVITAYFTIPKSASKKQRQAMLDGEIRPQKKPDTDNIAKIILDSLNTIAYDDDKQIVSLTVDKWYSDTPRVEVELSEIS